VVVVVVVVVVEIDHSGASARERRSQLYRRLSSLIQPPSWAPVAWWV